MSFNICFVAPKPPPYGGIANWVSEVCKFLEKQKVEFLIIDTSPKKRETEGRNILDRVIGGGIGLIQVRNRAIKAIRRYKPNVLHLVTSGSLSVIRDLFISSVFNKYKIPVVYHIHFGRIPDIVKRNTKEWNVIKKIIIKAKYVIAIDKPTYYILNEYFGDKIKYIPNPINTGEMPQINSKKYKKCMFLGWIIREKGIEELLLAWQEIVKEYVDWELELVGPYKDEYYKELQGKYSFDNISLKGEVSHNEAMELLNKSDIFILPSYTEGCPYVVMEALVLGKKVIASGVGNIPDMIEERNGTIVEVRNSSDLTDAIRESINEIDNFDRMLVHKSAINEYDIEIIMKKYFELWKGQV